jgi:putative ABC transport system permease protein
VLVTRLGVDRPWLQPVAIVRACVQLGVLSLLLAGIITDPAWVALFLTVMVLAATWVVVRRLDARWRLAPAIAGIILVAAAVPVTVVFATSAVEFTSRYALATAGIVIGNTMTVATLTGRTLLRSIITDRDEIEGWLALGASPRSATSRIARNAATTALIPSTDQTRTTGLVTLPGAFVGAVFAGASPLDAAQFQILVLASVLTSAAITATLTTALLGAPSTVPLDLRRP